MAVIYRCRSPHCGGTVHFDHHDASKNGREIGVCDRCGLLHARYGGQVRLISPVSKRRRAGAAHAAGPPVRHR